MSEFSELELYGDRLTERMSLEHFDRNYLKERDMFAAVMPNPVVRDSQSRQEMVVSADSICSSLERLQRGEAGNANGGHGVIIDREQRTASLYAKHGAMTYLLDPHTLRAVTPGFHEFRSVGTDFYVAKTGAASYLATPEEWLSLRAENLPAKSTTSHATGDWQAASRLASSGWGFPVLCMEDKIAIGRLGSIIGRTPVSKAHENDEDLFNLRGKDTHPHLRKASEIYQIGMSSLTAYAARNKPLRRDISANTTEIQLPEVPMEAGSSMRLTIAQTNDGNTQLILDGLRLDGTFIENSGFHLTRDAQGNSFIVPIDRNLESDIGTPGYGQQLDAALNAIQGYFKRLNTTTELGITSLNISLSDLSAQLSGQSGRKSKALLKGLLRQ
ncbi:hypothetical protein KY385_02345 [Candidatus Parcubacteria bacterium]|nr:hypothetical protein [Candidatus Parcubacteria bacterium]